MWRSWGIEPSVVLGHSLGEDVAAVIAGVFSVEDGLQPGVCAGAADGHLDAAGSDAIDSGDSGAGAAGDRRAGNRSWDWSDQRGRERGAVGAAGTVEGWRRSWKRKAYGRGRWR